jgi:hypothetical protein
MSAALEESYRRALRWYPRRWRERNADVALGTLLDVADAQHRSRPRRGELASLAASGVLARVTLLLAPGARDLIATIALATGVAYSLAGAVVHAWSPWTPAANAELAKHYFTVGPFLSPVILVTALWLVGLVFAFTRLRWALRAVMLLAAVATLTLTALSHGPGTAVLLGPSMSSSALLTLLAVFSCIGTSRRDSRLGIAITIAVAAMAMGFATIVLAQPRQYLVDRSFWGQATAPLMLILLVAVLVVIFAAARGNATLARVVMISALPWLVTLAVWLTGNRHWDALGGALVAAALIALGAGLATLIIRSKAAAR